MSYILDDWKDALEAFQDCVDKELAEIQQQKAEVQQLKAEVFNQLGGGLFYRDGDRIVISAPEEIGYKYGWITKKQLLESAKHYGKSPYGEHLKAVAEGRE